MKRTLITALLVLGGVCLMQTISSASGNLRYDNARQDSSIQYYVSDTVPHHLVKKYYKPKSYKLIEEDRKSWWGRAWWSGYAGYYEDSIRTVKPQFDGDPARIRLFVKDTPGGYSHSFRSTIISPSVTIDGYPHLPGMRYTNIISDNGDFRAWYYIARPISIRDQHSFGGIESDAPSIPRNYMHMYQAWGDLRTSHGGYSVNLDSAVRYLTHKDARCMFNADTVITYPFNMKQFSPSGRFLDKYTHLQIYIVQRRDRGFFTLYCFTTDRGRRDFKKHFRALQQIFRYED